MKNVTLALLGLLVIALGVIALRENARANALQASGCWVSADVVTVKDDGTVHMLSRSPESHGSMNWRAELPKADRVFLQVQARRKP